MSDRDLSMEMLRLIGEIHPTAFTGDMSALAQATASTADTFGGLFAMLRRHAPNEATAQAAMKLMVARALKFAEGAQVDADALRGQVAPAYREGRTGGRQDG
ncbi:hypothetical protein ASG40_11450 [Methylobacterium sp. Leaf399]|uniref:hypothetical protein n=1 Tax=Methylobacterium sp. Leaf399 TaxID=1736364 RepID=UPI0006F3DA0A|nr:hypothetical protein [Methylobacterium sp. Leaf399]KQT08489.1 hypothetical protein ASG40_11450 [Methylobacterium sp. Leaf399]